MRTSRRKPAKRVADPSKRIQDFTTLQEWYDNISDEDHARFCAASNN